MAETKRSANSKWILAFIICVIAIVAVFAFWKYRNRTIPIVIAPIPDVSTIEIDRHYCDKYPAVCEQRCAGCPDKQRCFASGGECATDVAGAETHIRDEMDRGPDIWLPGCHFYYDPGCVGNKQIRWGDACREKDTIEEWFERECHADAADHYFDDCNLKCQQLGLGKGWCVTDVGFCGEGVSSAHCECEKGRPIPPPTPTPTPSPSPSPSPSVQP
jgi:hypothetical protein